MTSACFVYYRVKSESADARAAVASVIDAVRRRTGVAGRWMRKIEEPLLWMEIYEGIEQPTAFAEALAEAVHAADFDRFLQAGSERKMENFVACA